MAIDNAARAMAVQGGKVLAQSAVAASHTGNLLETTLATITVPAGAMGANGQVEIWALFSVTNNANVKTPRIRLGGSAFYSASLASTASAQCIVRIANRNAANSQVSFAGVVSGIGSSSSAVATGAIDTSAAVSITITGQLAVATDTITLESYIVKVYPKS